ncbi:MAG: hypothetical protein GXO42_00020 [bacterium]|nr:hypothetical protein [bacterium]
MAEKDFEKEKDTIFKRILEDSKRNVKKIDISSFEEELKKRMPSFSEEIKVQETKETVELPSNIDEVISKELTSRLKLIDEFINKKLGEVDSRLRELERYQGRIEELESSILKVQSEIGKLKDIADRRYIDLEKELHRIEASVRQNVAELKKEVEDKISVLEIRLRTVKDHVDVFDKELASIKETYERIKEITKELAEKLASKIMEFQEMRRNITEKLEEIEKELTKLRLEENTIKSVKERINMFKDELQKLEKEIDLLVSKAKPEVVFEQEIEVKHPAQVETKENVPPGAEVKEENLKTETGEKKHKHIRLFGKKG